MFVNLLSQTNFCDRFQLAMKKMPQILIKNILTEGFIKYKLIDGKKNR